MKKRIFIPILLVVAEVSLTALKLTNEFSSIGAIGITDISGALFMWGILFLMLALALIFGVENRYTAVPFTNNNGLYDLNVVNFIGSLSKNFYTRLTDFSTGTSILILSFLNLIIYAIVINL